MRLGRRTRLPGWLMIAVLGGTGLACTGDSEPVPEPELVRSLELVFRREADERILVVDADADRVLRTLEAGEGGFLRGALRPLERERRRHDVAFDTPFTLALHDDGSLVLQDPPTGMSLDVAAFGATSREQFLTLLDGREPPAHPTLSTPNGTMEDRP